MQSAAAPPSTEGLPRQFVSAMRTLFEVMDEKGSGYVRLADLEQLWREERTQGVPRGVIASLRKVTPASGLLTFERFCAGLQICLLHCQPQGHKDNHQFNHGVNTQDSRSPSAPLLDCDTRPVATSGPSTSKATATTKAAPPLAPRGNQMSQQRAVSLPQLSGSNGEAKADRKGGVATQPTGPPELRNYRSEVKLSNGHRAAKSMAVCGPFGMPGPPKPPRDRAVLASSGNHHHVPTGTLDHGMGRAEIRSALQNWQKGLMQNEGEGKGGSTAEWKRSGTHGNLIRPPPPPPPPPAPPPSQVPSQGSRGFADGKPEALVPPAGRDSGGQRRAGGRRREPRRHTVQNGIDYNMLKRLKQLEQEKDVLLQGLQAVERARDWYLQQIASAQDKMKYLGRDGGLMESSLEAAQERLNFQMARIAEANQLLQGLVCNSSRRFPLHMNLAVPAWGRPLDPPYPWAGGPSRGNSSGGAADGETRRVIERLKEQNHLLTEEVSRQSERITALEREKSALIRELFQARSKQHHPSTSGGGIVPGTGWPETANETVFM